MSINDLVGQNICKLTPYSPGKPIEEVEREFGISNVIKMASNENPLGPSPKAVEAMKRALDDVAIYPDGSCFRLVRAVAEHWNVSEDMITVGNGSDDLIHLAGLTFLQPGDEVVLSETTFSRYESAVVLNCCNCVFVPLDGFSYDLDAMADKITDRTKMVFIANPNNPTGTAVSQEQVDRFMARVPERVVVVFDEAYNEYVSSADFPDTVKYVREGRNVLVLHTFSKIYALAGLRVGYSISRPELAGCLNQVREPFNVNSLAQSAAIVSLADKDHVERSRRVNAEGRAYLYEQFDAMGLTYAPSETNFVWVDVKADSRQVFTEMLKRGVIVRTGDIFGHPTFIRVTIGTADQNERFIETLKSVLSA